MPGASLLLVSCYKHRTSSDLRCSATDFVRRKESMKTSNGKYRRKHCYREQMSLMLSRPNFYDARERWRRATAPLIRIGLR